jgi:EpsI family protein
MNIERAVGAPSIPGVRGRWFVAFAIFVVMFGSTFLAGIAKPTQRIGLERSATPLDQLVPLRFGDWQIDESASNVIVNPQVQERVAKLYSDVLSRTYVDSRGRRVMLSIAYGLDQSDATQLHRPEACYPAQGFVLQSRSEDELRLPFTRIEVRRLQTRLSGRYEPVTYWVLIGDQMATGRLAMKKAEILHALRGQVPDGLIFRVSSLGRYADIEFKTHNEFVGDLMQWLPQSARLRLLGQSAFNP